MENMQKWVVCIISLIVFVICIALIVTGQRTVGLPHLLKMIVGLLGLIGLLYLYNKNNQ